MAETFSRSTRNAAMETAQAQRAVEMERKATVPHLGLRDAGRDRLDKVVDQNYDQYDEKMKVDKEKDRVEQDAQTEGACDEGAPHPVCHLCGQPLQKCHHSGGSGALYKTWDCCVRRVGTASLLHILTLLRAPGQPDLHRNTPQALGTVAKSNYQLQMTTPASVQQ